MEREIRLNLDVLESYNISVNDFVALWKIHLGNNINFNTQAVNYYRLQDEKFLKIIKNEKKQITFILRDKALELIEFLSTGIKRPNTKKKKKQLNVDLLTRIPEYRSLWKGLQLGSMGSAKACKEKLARWMEENPEYTFDQILEAARLYIESLRGDYRFLQRADYFIYKQENNREESSRLSAFIDEVSNGATSQGDWTTKLN